MQGSLPHHEWEQAAVKLIIDRVLVVSLICLSATAILFSGLSVWAKLLILVGLMLISLTWYRRHRAMQVISCSLHDGQWQLSLRNGRRVHAAPVSAYLSAGVQALVLRGADGRTYTLRMWPWPGCSAAQRRLRLLVMGSVQTRRQDS